MFVAAKSAAFLGEYLRIKALDSMVSGDRDFST
jgi:hypothetical protein